MKLTEDTIRLVEVVEFKARILINSFPDEPKAKQLKRQILQNQKLRELVEKRLSNLSDAPRDNSVAGNDAEQERLKYKLFLAQLLEESKT